MLMVVKSLSDKQHSLNCFVTLEGVMKLLETVAIHKRCEEIANNFFIFVLSSNGLSHC